MATPKSDAELMWEKFCRHFSFTELCWLSDKFGRLAQRDGLAGASVPELGGQWLQHRWKRRLQSYEVDEDNLKAAATMCSVDLAESLSFEKIVKLLDQYQVLHLESDKFAGFSKDFVARFETAFNHYEKGGKGLKAKSLWDALKEVGVRFQDPNQQLWVVDIVREMHGEHGGTIDFCEFCKILRKIKAKGTLAQLRREFDLVVKSGMPFKEAEEWMSIFEIYDDKRVGELTVAQVRLLFQNIGLKWGSDDNSQLVTWISEYDENRNDTIDFGEFCCIVRKMWDSDFCGIREIAMKAKNVSPSDVGGSLGSQLLQRRRRCWSKPDLTLQTSKLALAADPEPLSPKSPFSPINGNARARQNLGGAEDAGDEAVQKIEEVLASRSKK